MNRRNPAPSSRVGYPLAWTTAPEACPCACPDCKGRLAFGERAWVSRKVDGYFCSPACANSTLRAMEVSAE